MFIPTATHKDVAIIGIAGRFPGASNPDEFYQLLLDQKEALSLFPETSNTSATLPDTKHVPVRGALLDVNYFDFSHWGIPEDEAR
jgi:acyl transferase domain-containing protein